MILALLICMLLFMGFCAAILAMGICDIFGERESAKPAGVKAAQTGNNDRDG